MLAQLDDLAGEGLASWVWARSASDGRLPREIGTAQLACKESGYSYRDAWVAERDGRIAGMLLGYRQPDPYVSRTLAPWQEPIRPIVELEAHAPGSWYVNALAVLPAFQRRGIATRLLAKAEELALVSGAAAVSVIVAEENKPAVALYRRNGFAPLAQRTIIPWAAEAPGGDWLLTTKAVPKRLTPVLA